MRRLLLLVTVAVALVVPALAEGAIVVRRDLQGRTITFDVPRGMNVNPYAAVLRRALHGGEIEWVTISFVDAGTLRRECGGGNVSCYLGGRWRAEILLSARGGSSTRHVLLHEYAHHLDASYGLTSSWRWEPAATRWWAARRIEQRLRTGAVAFEYELGWQRSIGEIFAEDYLHLHARPRYGIGWLAAPSRRIRAALRRDILDALRD